MKDKRFLDEMIFDIRSHLSSFIAELLNKYRDSPFVNRSIFDEFGYYHPRKKMIVGIASAAVLDRGLVVDQVYREGNRLTVCTERVIG